MAEPLWAEIKDDVASLRECVRGQHWPAWGPIVICCVRSANRNTQRLLMCDICLGERGGNTPECMTLKKQSVARFPTDSKSSVPKKNKKKLLSPD